jgi:hypothetical protein
VLQRCYINGIIAWLNVWFYIFYVFIFLMLQKCFECDPDVLQRCFINAPDVLQRCFINGIIAWLNVWFYIFNASEML